MNQKKTLELIYKYAPADKIEQVRRLMGDIQNDVYHKIATEALTRELNESEKQFLTTDLNKMIQQLESLRINGN